VDQLESSKSCIKHKEFLTNGICLSCFSEQAETKYKKSIAFTGSKIWWLVIGSLFIFLCYLATR
jgi:hypothetical protein